MTRCTGYDCVNWEDCDYVLEIAKCEGFEPTSLAKKAIIIEEEAAEELTGKSQNNE